MDKKVLYYSKPRLIFLLVITIAFFLLCGVWLVSLGIDSILHYTVWRPFFVRIIAFIRNYIVNILEALVGVGSIVFGLITLVMIIQRLICTKPYLSFNETGIQDYPFFRKRTTITWDEVENIRLVKDRLNIYVVVKLHDDSSYLKEHYRGIYKLYITLNRKMYDGDYIINTFKTKTAPIKIYDMLCDYLNKYRKAR